MKITKFHIPAADGLRAKLCFALVVMMISFGVTPTLASGTIGGRVDDEPREVSMPSTLPFATGEQLVYSAEFSRSLLRGIDIAEVRFAAHKQETPTGEHNQHGISDVAPPARESAKEPAKEIAPDYNFSCEISSKSWFQRLFNLTFRLSMKSVVDAGTLIVRRTSKLDEQGKRRRESVAVFNRAENLVTWTERNPVEPNNPPRVVRTPLQGATQDLVSVFYYLRTRPLEPGARFEIALSDSGRIYRVPVTIGSRSKMKTVIGEIPVVEVTAEMFGEGRPVPGKGSMTLWFGDDTRRVPVRARIKSDDGTLDIKLKRMTNGAAAAHSKS